MLKQGWPVLVPAFLAAAVIGTKLMNFDVPNMLKINEAMSAPADKPAPKIEVPKANNHYGLETYQEPAAAPK